MNWVDGGDGIDLLDFSSGTAGIAFILYRSPWVMFTGIGPGLGEWHYNNFEGVIGTNYSDTLQGSEWADILKGGKGNDVIAGGHGADRLWGDEGADYIRGDGGADELWGGKGADTFTFAPSDSTFAAPDTIRDFKPGTDDIDLAWFAFASPATEAIIETNPGAFTAADTADFFDDAGADRAVVVEYNGGDARVFVDLDGNGDFSTAGDLVIVLENVAANSLALGDFVF